MHFNLQARAYWDPTGSSCDVAGTVEQRNSVVVTLACEFSLVVIMLIGVIRMRSPESGLWRVLYRQVRLKDHTGAA